MEFHKVEKFEKWLKKVGKFPDDNCPLKAILNEVVATHFAYDTNEYILCSSYTKSGKPEKYRYTFEFSLVDTEDPYKFIIKEDFIF